MQGPSSYGLAILGALQSRAIYMGTVADSVKEKRRKKSKAARIARRVNR